MKHYLLLAGLFACVLSASAQTVGTKPNVINQGINPMTQTDNRGKFINEQRVRDMQHDNLMADKHTRARMDAYVWWRRNGEQLYPNYQKW